VARLDTGWCVNPKVWALPWQGIALHAWSISYCDMARSSGFIPTGVIPGKRGSGLGVKALVDAGMWLPVDGGYQLHDYTEYNRTRAQIEAVGAAMRANGRAGGLARARANGQQTG